MRCFKFKNKLHQRLRRSTMEKDEEASLGVAYC